VVVDYAPGPDVDQTEVTKMGGTEMLQAVFKLFAR
jgi:hypothetical protein